MKTFIKIAGILCLLSIFLTLPACGSDDDDDNKHRNPVDIPEEIVGNWVWLHEIEPEFYSFKSNGDVIFQAALMDSDTDEWIYEYYSGTYHIIGEKIIIIIEYDNGPYEDAYEYKIKNDKLILTELTGSSAGDSYTYNKTRYRSLEECLE